MAKNLCPIPGAWVLSLLRKLRYHIPYGAVKKKKVNAIKVFHHPYILLNQHFIYLKFTLYIIIVLY